MPKRFLTRNSLLGAAIILATLIVYIPAMQGGFIWDDDSYVTQNQTLRSTEGLAQIWLEPLSSPQYYPLVFSSFWLEYQLWGVKPAGYHMVNVLLHGFSAVLLWLLLARLGVPGAWLAALVFALHPVHTESVAWVTERKNVLSGLLYFSSALCLVRFFGLDGDGEDQPRQWGWYGLGLFLFLCALLSKTVTCSLPAAMILVLWWKRGRVRWRDVAVLVPFFLLGLVLGFSTAWLERHHVGAEGLEWVLSPAERFLVAGRALWFYAWKLVWPAELIFTYPRWQIDATVWWQYAYPLGVFLVVAVLWAFRKRVGRGALVGVLFFCGTLFPALGFFDVYPFRYSYVADHFQYLASVGFIVLVVAGITSGGSRLALWPKRIVVFLGFLLLASLGMLTWRQGHIYENLETLWTDTLNKNPLSWHSHYNLGNVLTEQGRFEEAMAHFAKALEIRPGFAESQYNLAILLAKQGRLEEAVSHLSGALRHKPQFADAHNNLGNVLVQQGKIAEAVSHYGEALKTMPNHPEAHFNLGNLLAIHGRSEEAISHLTEHVRIRPLHADAHYNLGALLAMQGRPEEAMSHLSVTLRINPNHADAHYNLGTLLVQLGRLQQASSHYSEALRIRPDHAAARRNLELVLQAMGKP